MKRWKILARVLMLMVGTAVLAQTSEVPQAQRPASQHRMGVHVADGRFQTGEQLTATREDGQSVRLTVQRELSFLVGPGFTPQKP